jgi:ABC-2 type transport system permease protein
VIRLVRAELLKLRTTQVWFWMLLAALAVTVLFVVGQLAPSDHPQTSSAAADVFTSSGTAYIVVFVLGVLGVTTEFRYQTITPTVLTTPSRWRIVTAKLIAYLVVGAAYALACTVVMFAVAVPWLSGLGVHTDLGRSDLWRAIGGVFVVVALFGIVGLGIGALLRNQIVAVSVGVVFLLVINNLLAIIPGVRVVYPYTPNGAVAAILTIHGSRQSDSVTLLPAAGGIAVLVLWAIVPALVGATLTMTRDIT